MAADTKTDGKTDELKGKAQEAWGDVTGDEDKQAEGKANQAKGHTKQAVGQVQDAFDDVTDDK